MTSSNQLTSYVFSDRKLIPMQAEMAQSQISDNNNSMFFHLSPASIQVQSNNDKKQKSNNETTDQIHQQQSVQSLMDIAEQQPGNGNADNDLENRHNDNSFLLELMSTVQNYPAVRDITTRLYRDLHKKTSHGKI